MICLGFELADRPNILITLALHDASRQKPLGRPQDGFEIQRELIALKELRIARCTWLAVRDDFRDWFVRNTA